jgi:hypothetical protein
MVMGLDPIESLSSDVASASVERVILHRTQPMISTVSLYRTWGRFPLLIDDHCGDVNYSSDVRPEQRTVQPTSR